MLPLFRLWSSFFNSISMSKEKLYNLVVNEKQLRLIADCVEDCSRFAGGQFGMTNTVAFANVGTKYELDTGVMHDIERECERRGLIPALEGGSYLKYNATPFVGNTYHIYREIRHFFAVRDNLNNVYSSASLPSSTIGTIKIEERSE